MHIDVVSQINLKSNGSAPVKVFSDGNLNAGDLVVSSLRFGPGGATVSHANDTGFGMIAHFGSQSSGIRPSDKVAFLTGELPDRTMVVGMGTIGIVTGT